MRSLQTSQLKGGFTLIELLIVIAIIAILALIAIPNFLEAQTRSKATRAEADMRSIATAMEAYFVDFNAYPFIRTKVDYMDKLAPLTTPMAYLTSLPKGAFKDYKPFGGQPTLVYYYQNKDACDYIDSLWGVFGCPGWQQYDTTQRHSWYLSSVGPDGVYDQAWSGTPGCNYLLYDPTNGTVSKGDIIRMGP